eukprot:1806049-Amphidinium_carterae.2
MAQSSPPLTSTLESDPVTWEEALRTGSRSVRLTERLLSRTWLMPFPLPVDSPQEQSGDQEQSAETGYTEMTILGLYWGHAAPTQSPHSVLLALPEIAAAGVEGATNASVPCVDVQGTHVGEATCAMFVASSEYVNKCMCESCPSGCSLVAFMDEIPGCLPVASLLFSDEHIPQAAQEGTWLFLDDQGAVRLRTDGVTVEDMYLSAVEADDSETAVPLTQLQPWLGEAAIFAVSRRGRQRRPSIVGLGGTAKQLAAVLNRPAAKKAAPVPKVKAAAAGQPDPMLQQILAAVSEIGTRVATLEQHQHQQQQQQSTSAALASPFLPKAPTETLQSKSASGPPPPIANPWTARPGWHGGSASGFLPCGAGGGGQSVLAPNGVCGSYEQAVAEAQRLLGTALPAPPPVASRCIPTGIPAAAGLGGGPAKSTRSRKKSRFRSPGSIAKRWRRLPIGGESCHYRCSWQSGSRGKRSQIFRRHRPSGSVLWTGWWHRHRLLKGCKCSRSARPCTLGGCDSERPRALDSAVQQCGSSCFGRRLAAHTLDHGRVWCSPTSFQGQRISRKNVGVVGPPSRSHDARRDISGIGADMSISKSHRVGGAVQWALASRLEFDVLAGDSKPGRQLGGSRARTPIGVSRKCAMAAGLQHHRGSYKEGRPAGGAIATAAATAAPQTSWRQAARQERTKERAVSRGKQLELEGLCDDLHRMFADHTVPLNRSRLREKKIAPTRSMLMGAYTAQGQGVTQSTRLPWVRDVLGVVHSLARLRDLSGLPGGYTSVNCQANHQLHAHRDRNNYGQSWLLACGNFQGGQLWLEAVGSELTDRRAELVPLPEELRNAAPEGLMGRLHDVRQTWIAFSGQRWHAALPSTGHRLSVALFCPRSLDRLLPSDWRLLQQLEFPCRGLLVAVLRRVE